MRTLFATITLLLIPIIRVFAHEEEIEITNLAEAEWVGPLVATLIITATIMLARIIHGRSNRQMTNK